MPKEHRPWLPVPYELADVTAIQALMRGDCTPDLQQRALKWIIEQVCGTYDQSFYPGEDGHRATDFAEGRRFVGNTLVKMTRLNVSQMRQKEEK